MAAKALPAQDVLLQLLSYDPETGKLFWKERGPEWFVDGKISAEKLSARWNKQFANREAGQAKGGGGYLFVTILCASYLTHRVIWKLLHGNDPVNVDHINGIRADNRSENLREVNEQDNHRNKCMPNTNTSGTIGVRYDDIRGKWIAAITDSGRTVFLGRFDTFEDATEARKLAEVKYGFHENHGRAA